MKLVLSQLPDNFSFDTHTPLGTWCFAGNESIENWKSFNFPDDPFQSSEDWINFEKDCSIIINNLFEKLYPQLNEINSTKKNKIFWWYMTGHWLTSMVLSVAMRSLVLDKAQERYFDKEIEVNIKLRNKPFGFQTSNQFVYEGVNNPSFNEWIYSELIESDNRGWKVTKSNEEFKFKSFSAPVHTFKYKIRLFIEEFLRVKRVYGTTFLDQFKLSLSLYLKKKTPQPKTNFTNSINPRNSIPERFSNINWDKISSLTMPGLLKNIKLIDKKFLLTRNGHMIVCGTMLYANENEKIKIANFVADGGLLEVVQHGCNYGYSVVHSSLKFIESFNTKFITWGWSAHLDYDVETVPLPTPLIQSLKNKYQEKRKDSSSGFVYMIGRDPNPFVYWLYSCTQPKGLLKYFNQKLKFLSNLNSKIINNVFYRPAPYNPISISDTNFLKKHFTEMTFDIGGNIHENLFRSKIVICDTPGTTFHICMGANIPVIGVWDHKDYYTVPQAFELIKGITDAKIVHSSHEEAAIFLNSTYDNIEQWWSSNEVQTQRLKWVEKYAFTQADWLSTWKKYLRTNS